jgi:hypothetical protein
MATVLLRETPLKRERAQDSDGKSGPDASNTSINSIPPLGAVVQGKQFWWQKSKVDLDATATQVRFIDILTSLSGRACCSMEYDDSDRMIQPSVFDDPETAERYYPPPTW